MGRFARNGMIGVLATAVSLAGAVAVTGSAFAVETATEDENWSMTVSDATRYADTLDSLLGMLEDRRKTIGVDRIDDPTLLTSSKRLRDEYRGLAEHPDTGGVNILNKRGRTGRLHETVVRESRAIDVVTDRIEAIDRSVAAKRLGDARTALDKSVRAGGDAYRRSEGRVLDAANRDGLKRLLDNAASDRRGDSADQIDEDRRLIDEQAVKVGKDVRAWQAEQARQAAITARRAAAARQASTAGYTSGGGGSVYNGRHGAGGYDASGSSYDATTSGSYEGVDGTSAQSAIDGGGMVRMNWGDTVVYGQHSNTGGAWINNLQAGQTVTIDGQRYRVDGREQQGAVDAPTDGGQWLQTCNGNGNHLVGITPIG